MAFDVLGDRRVVGIDLFEQGDHRVHKVCGVTLNVALRLRTIEIDQESSKNIPVNCSQYLVVVYWREIHYCADQLRMMMRIALERSDSGGQFHELLPGFSDAASLGPDTKIVGRRACNERTVLHDHA